MIYLDVEDLLHIAERVLGEVEIHDLGLLESAAARQHATAFGRDAYPTLHEKVAALAHSIARNHALIDGNKRLALAAILSAFGVNDLRVTVTNDEAYDLIMDIATGRLDDVASISTRLVKATVEVTH